MAHTTVTAAGEPVGMSHNINSELMSQGLKETQKGLWIQFSCPVGIAKEP